MICPPELVGGAEANQKGFGERMPETLQDRSGMGLSAQESIDSTSSTLTLSSGVDHFFAAVDAVATRIKPAPTGVPVRVDHDAATLEGDSRQRFQELAEFGLADGHEHEIGFKLAFAAGYRALAGV